MWHMTHDMWHMSHDRWGEVNLLSKKLSSSHGLGVKVYWRYFHKPWVNLIIDGVCKTAPATPGLLKSFPTNGATPSTFVHVPSRFCLTSGFAHAQLCRDDWLSLALLHCAPSREAARGFVTECAPLAPDTLTKTLIWHNRIPGSLALLSSASDGGKVPQFRIYFPCDILRGFWRDILWYSWRNMMNLALRILPTHSPSFNCF